MAVPTGTRATRARWLVAGVVVVVVGALVVGRQVLARAPRLEPGPVARYDEQADASVGSRQANDGFVVVTDPADGTYDGLWTFRNTGPVPMTVRLPAEQPAPGLAVHLVRLDPDGGLLTGATRPTRCPSRRAVWSASSSRSGPGVPPTSVGRASASTASSCSSSPSASTAR